MPFGLAAERPGRKRRFQFRGLLAVLLINALEQVQHGRRDGEVVLAQRRGELRAAQPLAAQDPRSPACPASVSIGHGRCQL